MAGTHVALPITMISRLFAIFNTFVLPPLASHHEAGPYGLLPTATSAAPFALPPLPGGKATSPIPLERPNSWIKPKQPPSSSLRSVSSLPQCPQDPACCLQLVCIALPSSSLSPVLCSSFSPDTL